MKARNSRLENMPVSLSHLKYLGIPKGLIMVSKIASIKAGVALLLIGASCMYPVNISTARNIALLPFFDCGSEGIMSQAHVTLGA
jgi:hypothetical protein